jgi:hypothetical protein
MASVQRRNHHADPAPTPILGLIWRKKYTQDASSGPAPTLIVYVRTLQIIFASSQKLNKQINMNSAFMKNCFMPPMPVPEELKCIFCLTMHATK